MITPRSNLQLMLWVSFVLMLILSGCSGCDDDPKSSCEETSCTRGSCDADTGQCVNPASCQDDSACLAGYQCNAQSSCEAITACSAQLPCARGQCRDGACVSEAQCQDDSACASPDYCDVTTNTCKSDPCQDGTITCARGVCDRAQGQCVNEVICSSANEDTACLEGSRCVSQKCVDEATFCGQLNCARGQCDFESLACADAINCQGQDMLCLAGKYCDDQGRCRPNVCDAQMTQCPRGQCDPDDGSCVNPASCTSSEQCLDANVCLGDVCVAQDQACGQAGCPGTQRCDYDAATRTASCQEDPVKGCVNALDCVADRACIQGACADAPACQAEATPNDTEATATDFDATATNQRLEGSLCAADVDYYRIDSRAQTPNLGQLIVELTITPADVGLGRPVLELIGPNNAMLGQAKVDEQGLARLQTEISIINQGDYLFVVRDDGDVKTPGLRYTLSAGVFVESTLMACASPKPLTANMSASSDTRNGASNGLRVACGQDQPLVPEDIWSFTLTERSFAKLTLTPDQGSPALAMSLRSSCLSANDLSCANTTLSDSVERPLAPGTYFVVIQGANSTGGAYSLSLETAPAICTSADNSCKDMTTGLECNAQGTGFDEVTCGTGCNLQAGRCNDLQGDRCAAPVVMQGSTQSLSVEWSRLNPSVDPGATGCVPNNDPISTTAGPDFIVEIDVPANEALIAKLSDNGMPTSLYLLDDCDMTNSCLAAANGAALVSDETLTWYNDQATTRKVFLVADIAEADAQTPDSTLDLELKAAICAPNSITCGTDANNNVVSQQCNAQGDAISQTTRCDFGCDMASGQCNLPPNDLCSGAVTLTSGVTIQGNLEPYAQDYGLTSADFCVGTTTRRDAIYKIDLQAGDILDVELSSPFNPVLWIADDCTMDQLSACVTGSNRASSNGTERLRYVAPTAGTRHIVVTTTNSTSSSGWDFTLTATRQQPNCTPGSAPTCDAANVNLQYCDLYGLTASTTCTGGCLAGACATPSGDVCADATPLTGASGSISSAFSANTDQFFAPQGYSGQCYVQFQSQSTIGKDSFYRLDLQAGDLASVTLTTTTTTGSMFILEDCDGLDSCVANNPLRGSTTLQYLATQARSIYIVVDSSSTTLTTAYTLDWNITPGGTCVAGATRCQDATTAAVCAADGLSEALFTCPNGCSRQGCVPDLPAQDTCAAVAAAATDIGQGLSVYGDFSGLSDDITMTTSGSCVDGKSSAGPDLFYKAVVPPNQILTASVQGVGNSPVIYAITDCTDAEGTCIAGGGEVGSSDYASFSYANTTGVAQTLIVAIDSSSTTAFGPFNAQLRVEAPQCTPGQTRCDASGQGLEVCNANGLYDSYACNGTCTNDSCDTPSGDFCFDAITLTGPSGSISDDWTGGSNTFAPGLGVTGECYIRLSTYSPAGRDDFYKIALQAGELLTATMTTTSTTSSLFILEDCVNPEACVKNNPSRGSTTLSYYADQAREVYLVVDNTSTTLTTPYTLDWNVSPGGVCAPNQTRCLNATTAALCDPSGASESSFTCANGCTYGGCQALPAAQDSCAAVAAGQDIGQGISVVAAQEDFTNDINIPASSSCADGQLTDGKDFFYKVLLAPGEIVKVEVQGAGNNSPLIYAISDCADPNNTCLAGGAEIGTTERASFTYANSTMAPETIIVGIDSSSTVPSGLIQAQISKLQPQCVPGVTQCDISGTAVLACQQTGLFERFDCATTCTNGRCDAPTGDVCVDAIDLVGATGSISGNFNEKDTNAYEPLLGFLGQSCYIHSSRPIGEETFYRVSLQAGEQLDVSMSTSSTTAYLFMLENCYDPNACIKNNAVRGDASLSYVADSAQTITLVVDNTSSTTTSAYTLDWNIGPTGNLCVAGETSCVDATTMARCDTSGQSISQISCTYGCANGACQADVTAQDTCATVLASPADVGSGLTALVTIQDFTNDIDMSTTDSCADSERTDGKDAFFKVVLADQEVLQVSALGLSGLASPIVYALADCSETASACLAGGREQGSTEFANFSYANNTGGPQTVIVGIDSSSTSPTGPVQLSINVEQPQCVPGTVQCDAAGTNLVVCNSNSIFEFYACNGTCTNGSCDTPTGDYCYDAIPLTGLSGSITSDWITGSSTYTPSQGYTGQCYVHLGSHIPAGKDDFYRIDLQAGELLTASLTTASSTASLFLLEGCVDPAACVKNNPLRGSTTLQYLATQARTLYLVVDNSSTTLTTEYTLGWDVSAGGLCAPNQTRCINATTAGKCNADGSVETPIPCANGCDITGCAPDVATQDSCATVAASAQTVTGSLSTYALMEDFTADVSMTTTGSCADGKSTTGKDFFYKVQLAPLEILNVSVQSGGSVNPAIYAITDCNDAQGTCVAGGGEVGTSEAARFTYANATGMTQTLIVAIDSSLTSPAGPIQVEIDISSPQCMPGVVQCDASGTNLLQCNSFGLFDTIPCNGGCSAGACATPTGDYCVDAIELTGATGAVNGTFNAQLNNTYQLGIGYTGACYLDTSSFINASQETFYRIALQAGEQLSVKLASGSTTGQLFLMTDCVDPNSCVATGPTRGSTELRYIAPSAQTVFIAVDNSSTSATQSYELSWFISSGAVCAAGTTTCLDPNTVSYCSPTGLTSAAATCVNGCFQGGCQAQAALQNLCADVLAAATDVGAGLAIYARYEDFTNSISFSSANSCAGGTTPGRDLFYKVNLAAGEVVRVSAQGYGSNNPIVYVIEDCSLSASSCLAGAREQGSSDAATTSYANNTGMPKTVLVGIDSSLSSPTGPVKATIERLAPECTPGAKQCAADGADLLQCSPQGLFERFPCEGGCANDACVIPSGDFCFDATPLNPGGTQTPQQYTDFEPNFQDLTPTLALGTSGCLGTQDADGPEKFYSVILGPGQSLDATMVPTSTDIALYVVTDCNNPLSCVAPTTNSDAGGFGVTERVVYTNSTGMTQTVFLVADSHGTAAAGGYDLTVDIQ